MRDRSRAPPALRRLVAAQGKARPGRVDGGRRGARDPRGDRASTARLGPWLRDVRYAVADGRKFVRYWSAQALDAGRLHPERRGGRAALGDPGRGEEPAELRARRGRRRALRRAGPADVGTAGGAARQGREPVRLGRATTACARCRPPGGSRREQLAELLPLYGPDRVVSAPAGALPRHGRAAGRRAGSADRRRAAAQRSQLRGRPGRHAQAGARAGGAARGHRGLQPGRRDPGRGRGAGTATRRCRWRWTSTTCRRRRAAPGCSGCATGRWCRRTTSPSRADRSPALLTAPTRPRRATR